MALVRVVHDGDSLSLELNYVLSADDGIGDDSFHSSLGEFVDLWGDESDRAALIAVVRHGARSA